MNTTTVSKTQTLIAKDKQFLWHPFTQMTEWQSDVPLVVERGDGVYLIDTEGRRYIDGVSSLWCNVHGHRKAEIDEALCDQIGKIAHSTFLGLTHEPGILLAEKLVSIAPAGLRRVFYSDSGSEAVEIALKMAYQYWQNKGERARTKFVKLGQAYHGDTIGSVSVGGIDLFHRVYRPLLFETMNAAPPGGFFNDYGRADPAPSLEEVLERRAGEIAAIIMEPLVQGAAGMLTQPKGFMSHVRALAAQYNVLLIFDEVATGFGRTGKMFAADHERVTPDLMTVSKGLTAGYLPLAATLTTEAVYEAFLGRYDEFKTFFHGHTFTGNQLGCRAALANIGVFEKENTLAGLDAKIARLASEWPRFYELPAVGEIRQAGMMAGIELTGDRARRTPFPPGARMGKRVSDRAREWGAVIRPLGDVVVLMPPLGMPIQVIGELLDITYRAIRDTTTQ